ncbi:predicted protein [Postia placenta Mad-698-R]|nr:predicted protein [Postia placenta Mad-698-R]
MAQNVDTAGSGPTGCQIEHMFGTAGISFFAPSSANVFTSMGESVPSIVPTTKLPMTGRNYTSEAHVARREHSADTLHGKHAGTLENKWLTYQKLWKHVVKSTRMGPPR